MNHLSSITIKGYKGIKKMNLNHFGSVNILVGDNNTCKTTILEAINLYMNQLDIYKSIFVENSREHYISQRIGISDFETLKNIFHYGNEKLDIQITKNNETKTAFHLYGQIVDEIPDDVYLEKLNSYLFIPSSRKKSILSLDTIKKFVGTVSDGMKERKIELSEFDRAQSLRVEKTSNAVVYVSSIDHLTQENMSQHLSDIIRSNLKSELIELLRLFDDNLEDFDFIPSAYDRTTPLYIKHKQFGYMPLANYGDGTKKVISLISSLIQAKHGILLIDEIETAIHTSAMHHVSSWLVNMSKRLDIQLFMTTHSNEALQALVASDVENMMCYRIEQYKHDFIVREFEQEQMYDILLNEGGDLR